MDGSQAYADLHELLKGLRADGTGLPNLPLLQQYLNYDETFFTLGGVTWEKVASNDPSRWILQIGTPDNGPFQYTTKPDNAGLVGTFQSGGPLILMFKDYLQFMQSDFYCWTRGGTGAITVVTATIRLRGQE